MRQHVRRFVHITASLSYPPAAPFIRPRDPFRFRHPLFVVENLASFMLDRAEAVKHEKGHSRHPEQPSSFCSNLIPALKRRVDFGCLESIASSAILSEIRQ